MGIEIGLSNCVFGRRPPVEDDFRQFHDFNIKYMEVSLARKNRRPGGQLAVQIKGGALNEREA